VSAVLLLGSEWSVAAPVDPEALRAECALVRAAGDAGVPVLGLCYGAQVLAHAYGGRVGVAPVPEVGLVHVETTDERLVPPGPWSAFHVDVLEPPPGADVVARNGCGVQAFRMTGALGVQFHPEVLPETLDDWAGRFPDLVSRLGLRPDELGEQARRREGEARRNAHALVDAFLDRVSGAPDHAPPAIR
jgi:GMP synthase-like glutamine amidotransferase